VEIIYYIFKNGQVDGRKLVRPQGNSNTEGNFFSRTFQTTKDRMKTTAVPTDEFRSLIISENGGLANIDNTRVLPRNYKQLNYERVKDQENVAELAKLLFKNINTPNSSSHFVECIPELSVLLFNNQQKTDIPRFCENYAGCVFTT